MRRSGSLPAKLIAAGLMLAGMAAFATLLSSNPVLGQSGSTGGTLGKINKSISGGDDAAPPQEPRPRAGVPQRALHQPAESPTSIAGRWQWNIKCPTANFTGLLDIVQTGNSFTGQFGHTNFWDNGTISNGQLHGTIVTFDREYFGTDHVRLALTNGGSVMQGPHYNATWGHCLIFSKKN